MCSRRGFFLCSLLAACFLRHFISIHSQSPTADEPAFLAAGISHWGTGSFRAYRVNPPLARLFVTAGLDSELKVKSVLPIRRVEYVLGKQLFDQDRARAFQSLLQSRMRSFLFFAIGFCGVFWLGCLLRDVESGYTSSVVFSVEPNIVAHSFLATCDVAFASLLILTTASILWFGKSVSTRRGMVLGLTLGLMLSTKFSALVVAPVMIAAICYAILQQVVAKTQMDGIKLLRPAQKSRCGQQIRKLLNQVCLTGWYASMIAATAVFVVCGTYAFSGVTQKIDELPFRSSMMIQIAECVRSAPGCEHFLPPLPKEYWLGVDEQYVDVEEGRRHTLWERESAAHGFLDYYLLTSLVKEPICLWILLGFVACQTQRGRINGFGFLFLVALLVFGIFVFSNNTGLQMYRYIIWAVAIGCVLIGAGIPACRLGKTSWASAMVAMILSGTVWPGSRLDFANVAFGGPYAASDWLNGVDVEWGQDGKLLEDFLENADPTYPVCLSSYSQPFTLDFETASFAEAFRKINSQQTLESLLKQANVDQASLANIRMPRGIYVKSVALQWSVEHEGQSSTQQLILDSVLERQAHHSRDIGTTHQVFFIP